MRPVTLLGAATPARGLTIAVFLAVLAVTLGITFWAARRIQSATDFWSAGRGISGMQNGWRSRASSSPQRPSSESPG
jgi:cation/acetate symporter